MRKGYAKSVRESPIPKLPGSKTIPFKLGKFKLLDCYFVTPNGPYSFGQTIIWYDKVPVWEMSYQGWYDGSAIPFLKRALQKAYDLQRFFGGRGPRFFMEDGEMTYMNDVEPPNDWRHFHGQEGIVNCEKKILGWYEYQGFLLV